MPEPSPFEMALKIERLAAALEGCQGAIEKLVDRMDSYDSKMQELRDQQLLQQGARAALPQPALVAAGSGDGIWSQLLRDQKTVRTMLVCVSMVAIVLAIILRAEGIIQFAEKVMHK